jgi:hypothetical protein
MSGQVLAQLLRFTSAVCVLLGSNSLVRDTRAVAGAPCAVKMSQATQPRLRGSDA